MIVEKTPDRFQPSNATVTPCQRPLRIALCPPEFQPLQGAINGELAEATYIIQKYIATGLQIRGHQLSFVAPRNQHQIICTRDINNPILARQTWSASRWFDLVSRTSWWVQRGLGVPYLNLFSNYRLYDAALQCLPGHDVVYERNSLYKFGIAMACKRLKLPYILYFEADDILEHDVMGKPITGLLRWQTRQAARYNLKAADCVICVSEALKRHLTVAWHIPDHKIVVFPNVAHVDRFQPDPVARAATRTELQVGDHPLIIFVGNFYKWHDVPTLLAAFAQVLPTQPNARLVLVGDGLERQTMMQQAASLGIDHAVQFTGLVPHTAVPRLLAAADIAVVPYPPMQTDLWLSPLKLFEYMASGKAVIASAVGQLMDVVQDGRNGLLVAPGDISAMTVALQHLINNPRLRQQLGQQARQDVIQKHSWEQYISRLEHICAAVVAGESFA